MDELPRLTHADFAGLVGETFAVPDAGHALELAEATEGSVVGQFSLVFTGLLERAMPQGTVRLEHAELGELLMFLVPLGPAGDTMRYEAAFA